MLSKPNNRFVEFLVPNAEDQKDMTISVEVDEEGNFKKGMKIEGSADNNAFLDYIKFLNERHVDRQTGRGVSNTMCIHKALRMSRTVQLKTHTIR